MNGAIEGAIEDGMGPLLDYAVIKETNTLELHFQEPIEFVNPDYVGIYYEDGEESEYLTVSEPPFIENIENPEYSQYSLILTIGLEEDVTLYNLLSNGSFFIDPDTVKDENGNTNDLIMIDLRPV